MSLSSYYLECGSHLARLQRRRRRRCRAYAPTSNTASRENHEKINSWVSFCFPYEYGALFGGPSGRRSSAVNARGASFPRRPGSYNSLSSICQMLAGLHDSRARVLAFFHSLALTSISFSERPLFYEIRGGSL